jgi:quinoprotein glucose dehydrogenase
MIKLKTVTLLAGFAVSLGWTVSGWAQKIDESALALKPVKAFPDLEFTGWDHEDNGKVNPLRPILLTNAGDGSGRIFVPTQQGTIHSFPADGSAKKTSVFVDLSSKVQYIDKENEEGFLGLAFSPNYKEDGEFYAYYTTKDEPHTSVVSRFRRNPNHPEIADASSEQEILRIPQPFWNHNGGTICFGPDGYLYIALGDGGAGNDPLNHAQNLQTLLGSILRIDVTKKDQGLAYAIPKDNPFVNLIAPGGKQAIARGEIFAYGMRNPWRMSFDRKTGDFWVADVGQNVWEEINIVTKGGNYGWNLRESKHPFAPNGTSSDKTLIDPIWEYHHDIGKSITGGNVYRGKKLPELQGYYLYADYVSGLIWALKYDAAKKEVVENRSIPIDQKLPIISFGEDEDGEVYFTAVDPVGNGIYRFDRATK